MRSPLRAFGLRDLLKGLPVSEDPASGAMLCTFCGYCMPCPYGVDITGVFSVCARVTGENGSIRSGFLEDYERSVPYLRRANRCIGCGSCVPQCPRSIDVPGEMRRIDGLTESLKVRRLLAAGRPRRKRNPRGADGKREFR